VVAASIICAHIDRRKSYSEYFVRSGDDYDEVRESDRLLRVALILGVSGYWIYLAVVIAVAVGLGIGYKFSSSKCLPLTWMLTALVSLVCSAFYRYVSMAAAYLLATSVCDCYGHLLI